MAEQKQQLKSRTREEQILFNKKYIQTAKDRDCIKYVWFLFRTPQQRRENYAKLIAIGFDSYQAYRIRDWRPSKIKECLEGLRCKDWRKHD